MGTTAINARNRFKGCIREIVRGAVVSEVDVETPFGIVTSMNPASTPAVKSSRW